MGGRHLPGGGLGAWISCWGPQRRRKRFLSRGGGCAAPLTPSTPISRQRRRFTQGEVHTSRGNLNSGRPSTCSRGARRCGPIARRCRRRANTMCFSTLCVLAPNLGTFSPSYLLLTRVVNFSEHQLAKISFRGVQLFPPCNKTSASCSTAPKVGA